VAFDVELVGYRETVKVTDDGAVTKIILRQGEGYQTPNEVCVPAVPATWSRPS
jgi:hypothetical protein